MKEHHFKINDAIEYGINAAIILYNIEFWIDKNKANNKHFYDGYYWTYNTRKAFLELFPYLTDDKIRAAFNTLESKGIIKTGNYNKLPFDKTKWYTSLRNTGTSIGENENIDWGNIDNRETENPQTIPDSKPDSKPDTHIHVSASKTSGTKINTLEKLKAWDFKNDEGFIKWCESKTPETFAKISGRFKDNEAYVKQKIEDIIIYHEESGKRRSDFKATLKKWINRDIAAL